MVLCGLCGCIGSQLAASGSGAEEPRANSDWEWEGPPMPAPAVVTGEDQLSEPSTDEEEMESADEDAEGQEAGGVGHAVGVPVGFGVPGVRLCPGNRALSRQLDGLSRQFRYRTASR